MKIAFVLQSLSRGGAEKVASILCKEWSISNEVFVVFTSVPLPDQYEIPNKVHLAYLSRDDRSKLSKIRLLEQKLAGIRPDVCVAFLDGPIFYSSYACSRLRIPLVISERNFANYSSIFDRVYFRYRTKRYNKAQAIVYQTNTVMEDYQKRGVESRSFVIGNPVEDHHLSWEPKRKVFISAGRLQHQKNFVMGIDGFSLFFKEHPDFSYEIFGDGEEKPYMLEEIKKLGLSQRVFIHPFSNSVLSAIQTSYGLFLPSSFEGMPNILLEALSIGAPALSTDFSSGAAKDFHNVTPLCHLCKIDPASMAFGLSELANNHETDLAGSQSSKIRVMENFSSSSISGKWLNVLSGVLFSK